MAAAFVAHVIDGELVESVRGDRFESVDPWTRAPWTEVALGGHADVDRAVRAARVAADQGPWPRMGHTERGRLLHRLADLIVGNGDLLARTDTTDMGRPVSQTLARDVPRAAANFRFFADHARLTPAEALPSDHGHHAYTRHEPAGVVAAIAPWNLPLMLASWKIAPALAWGNTVVLKPAEQSPASAAVLARLALEAGIPPGVLNVVHGYGPDGAGQALTEHPGVDRITFTGESATGRAVSTAAARGLVPVSLELGGKNPALVFADADLDSAVRTAAEGAFGNAGQMCLSGSRIFVERAVYGEFVERLHAAGRAMTAGDPGDPATEIGPLASAEHHRKVSDHLTRARADGCRVYGGEGSGWLVRPAVLTDVPRDAPVQTREVFGPVATVTPFDHEEEAVGLANDTPFGLSATVCTTDLSRAHRVAARLRAGTVWVNCFFVRDLRAPFGGVGASGVGREGGLFSRDFFTEPKAVVVDVAGR
ncbi:aldehyde dehydrogenase [Micromonospora echinospora]|uniref:aldehyde dehydrogenase n=1 Tax=Micromonospora echinospora TaxID=1877 RepID=UPI00366BF244